MVRSFILIGGGRYTTIRDRILIRSSLRKKCSFLLVTHRCIRPYVLRTFVTVGKSVENSCFCGKLCVFMYIRA